MPQVQVLLHYFNIVLRAGYSLSCLQAAVRKQSREDRSMLFSATAWRKHVFKLCWNIPSLRPGCWILVPLMEIVCVSWQRHEFSYLPCSLPCPNLSSSCKGPRLRAFPVLWQKRRQSHKHIFTPSLPNAHGMTVKPKRVLQLTLISFSYCLNGHVSATKPSPQLQRNYYFNSPVPTQANALAAQGNQHPVLMDYATRWKENN